MVRVREIIFKKVNASSIVETVTASVVILIVFGIAMMTIANILESTVKRNTNALDKELNKLEYLLKYQKIQIPDIIETDEYTVEITLEKQSDQSYVLLKARSKKNNKKKTRRILE